MPSRSRPRTSRRRARVPEREREHAAQVRDEVESRTPRRGGRSPRTSLVGAEAVAARLEAGGQLAVVVDLAVADDRRSCRPRWLIGCLPPARSMIDRRRMPMASGPRARIAAVVGSAVHVRRRTSPRRSRAPRGRCRVVAPERGEVSRPAIPHMMDVPRREISGGRARAPAAAQPLHAVVEHVEGSGELALRSPRACRRGRRRCARRANGSLAGGDRTRAASRTASR